MARHRRPQPGTRRRAPVRPRYGRLVAACSSVTITAVAVLAGLGLVPIAAAQPAAAVGAIELVVTVAEPGDSVTSPDPEPVLPEETSPFTAPSEESSAPVEPSAPEPSETEAATVPLPADSGTGRRVVFSAEQQRVWLVDEDDTVRRTYLVSGSVYDNLDPGTYEVYSRSEQAVGIDDSGTMRYFVRFAHGERASIGFHDIPIDDGEMVQTIDQLGTPLSHGCIRQRRSDARALWRFAPLGTTVVVVD